MKWRVEVQRTEYQTLITEVEANTEQEAREEFESMEFTENDWECLCANEEVDITPIEDDHDDDPERAA